MHDTQKKLGLMMINTKDHMMSKRDLYMRLKHRKDFLEIYNKLLADNVLIETGTGLSRSVKMVVVTDISRLFFDSTKTPSNNEEEF